MELRNLDVIIEELFNRTLVTAKAKDETYRDSWKERQLWWILKKVKSKSQDLWDAQGVELELSELDNIVLDHLVYTAMAYEKLRVEIVNRLGLAEASLRGILDRNP